MADFDLTVVLTAHNETVVSGPTMHSVEAAIAAARAAGFTVEQRMVLDNATPETRAYLGQPAFDHWRREEVFEGDVGRTRNHAAHIAAGKNIAFQDADDLFSENWLVEGLRLLQQAEETGDKIIVHPELNWLFDGTDDVFVNLDQDDSLFTPYNFYFMNYYDALCMTPRSAHLDFPNVSRDIPTGLSFQDWQFSVETMAGGWRHVAAPDTIIFKRRRDDSLVTESRGRKSLLRQIPDMAIDRIAALGGRKAAPLPPPPEVPVTAPKPPKPAPKPEPAPEPPAPKGFLARFLPAKAPEPDPIPEPEPEPAPPSVSDADYTDLLPDPITEIPPYGQGVLDRVAWAESLQKPAGEDPQYDIIRAGFDMVFYLLGYPDIAAATQLDPIDHYIRRGVTERRNPNPYFHTGPYMDRYEAEVLESELHPYVHYLTIGRAKGYSAGPSRRFTGLAALLGQTPTETETHLNTRYRNMRHRFESGTLSQQVTKAAAFEPLLLRSWSGAMRVQIPPFNSELTVNRISMIRAMQDAADYRPACHVIVMDGPPPGPDAALGMATHMARALAAQDGADQVLVISTDRTGPLPKGHLPDGIRHIDFASAAKGGMRADHMQRLLVEFIRSLCPAQVVIAESDLMWQALAPHGKAIATSTKLVGCLLGHAQTALGLPTGRVLETFYRHFDTLAAICTDSADLAETLRRAYALPEDQAAKIHLLRAPVDPSIPPAAPPSHTPPEPDPSEETDTPPAPYRPQVFWTGRFIPQHRIDLLYAIARACPDIDFRLWGNPASPKYADLMPRPANIRLEGGSGPLKTLPLEQADAWLYTAQWGGVPQILLDVAMTGLPVIASNAGPMTEVFGESAPWLIKDIGNPLLYVTALRAILENPAKARAEAQELRRVLIAARPQENYMQAIQTLTRDIAAKT